MKTSTLMSCSSTQTAKLLAGGASIQNPVTFCPRVLLEHPHIQIHTHVHSPSHAHAHTRKHKHTHKLPVIHVTMGNECLHVIGWSRSLQTSSRQVMIILPCCHTNRTTNTNQTTYWFMLNSLGFWPNLFLLTIKVIMCSSYSITLANRNRMSLLTDTQI